MSVSADASGAPGAALAAIRKARAAAPRKDPLKAFTHWVAMPTAIIFAGVCALVLVTLNLMTSEINRIDGHRSSNAISAALDAFLLQLGEQVSDESNWTDAYLNAYASFNAAWLDGVWGSTARADGHYDTAIVTDGTGAILFGESDRGPLTGAIGYHYSGAEQLLAELDTAITQLGPNAVVTHFAADTAGVALLAGAVIHGAAGQMAIPAADRRILWLAKQIDSEMLNEIAHLFQVPIPHLAAEQPPQADEATLVLADAAGTTIGELVWRPLRPGDAAFAHAASAAVLVLLVVGFLVFAVLAAFRSSVQRRAEIDERDWVSARYDSSTGLLNRFGLEESIARRLTKRTPEIRLALAHIEFEGLKDIAGSYGQETVEKLLNRIAGLIDKGIEGQAQIARLGPDEFALCRSGPDADELIRKFARVVLEVVAEAIPIDDLRLKLGASIGVAGSLITKKTIAEPFRMAATALQSARETGGNHSILYEPGLEESRQKRLALQADIRRGLDAGEFDLDYQPIFDFSSQTMLGVEALLRWPRRKGGAMSPAEFIPAAEASGLIEELGLFALRRACEEILAFPTLKLSVNVSTVQFRSPALSQKIDAILAATHFPPERLQLEITESFLLAQPERAKAAIEELRNRGILIALDDFGTGFSSVGYLRQFRFDRVKLDRSLIDEVDLDPVKLALVESTMVFTFAMGLGVTAEGVERPEEAATLTRLGCREFQGYLFSRPVPIDVLARLVREQQQIDLREAG